MPKEEGNRSSEKLGRRAEKALEELTLFDDEF